MPILYTPYFEHADPSVKRKSGFLMPQPSISDTLGYSTTIPYYFALAPNYDFTFYPMYTSRQGVLWQGEWRHRTRERPVLHHVAPASTRMPPICRRRSPDRDQYDGWRGSLETQGPVLASSWWKFGWDVTPESDDTFRRFYKLDNMLLTDRVNKMFLAGISDRNYFGLAAYHFGGLMFHEPRSSEIEQYAHPILDYNYVFADPILGGELTLEHQRVEPSSNQDPTTSCAVCRWQSSR